MPCEYFLLIRRQRWPCLLAIDDGLSLAGQHAGCGAKDGFHWPSQWGQSLAEDPGQSQWTASRCPHDHTRPAPRWTSCGWTAAEAFRLCSWCTTVRRSWAATHSTEQLQTSDSTPDPVLSPGELVRVYTHLLHSLFLALCANTMSTSKLRVPQW